ncbi:MAG TPA: GNAT family N-acetyltransferase [Pyrinomonadaceae bacterium]|nr:GNAT family N-acetyltransferase [Pyrinomonadaceae bacterium]
MTKAIKQAGSLSEAEKQLLYDWGVDIFGADAFNLRWRPKDVHFLLDVDGMTVSHVGVLKHDVTIAGERVTVGGVGGVVTLPAWQKRGYASELMQHAVDFFRNWKVAAGLLFCMPWRVPFYESQGWRVVHHPVIIEQPDGAIVSPLEVMVFPLGDSVWPDGKVELNSFPW